MTIFGEGQRKHISDKAQVGDLVRIAGRLKDTSYERDGTTHYTTDRIIKEFGILVAKVMTTAGKGEGRARQASIAMPSYRECNRDD